MILLNFVCFLLRTIEMFSTSDCLFDRACDFFIRADFTNTIAYART